MPEVLNIFVRGIPKAQPRPRARAIPKNGKWIATLYTVWEEYLPHEKGQPRVRKSWDIGRWRDAIKARAQAAWSVYKPDGRNGHRGSGELKQPLTGPIRVDLTLYFPRTQEMQENPFKYGKDAIRYIKKPDRDNLDKAVLDALTEAGIWMDDAQVCDGGVSKWYSEIDGASGVRIVVETLTDETTLFEQSQTKEAHA